MVERGQEDPKFGSGARGPLQQAKESEKAAGGEGLQQHEKGGVKNPGKLSRAVLYLWGVSGTEGFAEPGNGACGNCDALRVEKETRSLEKKNCTGGAKCEEVRVGVREKDVVYVLPCGG